MSVTVETYTTRAEWLAAREGIGGSMAGSVLGLSRYESPLSCFARCHGRLDPIEDNEAMFWGRELEAVVMKRIREVAGQAVGLDTFERDGGFVIRRNVERPHLFVTVDGLCSVPSLGLGVVEAKTCGSWMAPQWEDEKIPDAYRAQVEHALAVLGPEYRFGLIGCLIGGQRFVWRLIERDEERIAAHVAALDRFWECVEADDASTLIDGHTATERVLNEAHDPADVAGFVDLNPNAAAEVVLETYRAAEAAIAAATESKRAAANMLKTLIGEHESALCGPHAIRWSSTNTRRLDSKRLKAEEPEVYDRFLKSSTGRRFTIKWGD